MSETRIITSDESSCACGCPTARVRIRGNAFAATCVSCHRSEIVPMLSERELADVFDEHDAVQPVHMAYARADAKLKQLRAERDEYVAQLRVRFELPQL